MGAVMASVEEEQHQQAGLSDSEVIKPGAISGTRQEGCFQVPLRSWELLCLCHHPCGSFHDVRLWLLLEPMRLVMSALSGLRPQSICASGLSGLPISLDCAVIHV